MNIFFASADFVVTRSPQEEAVSLQTDAPLFLSFMVCGRTADFVQQRLNFKIDLSRNGAKVRLTPRLNSSPVRDSQADRLGLSLSLLNTTSPNFEMCNEVLVRVWTDNPAIQNASIELLLITQTGPVPDVFRCGSYFLYSPVAAPVSATTPTPVTVTTPGIVTTPPSTTASQNAVSMQPQMNTGEGAATPQTTASDSIKQSTDECATIYLVISAILGSLLFVAIVIIIILSLVIKHHRKESYVVNPMVIESQCTKLPEPSESMV